MPLSPESEARHVEIMDAASRAFCRRMDGREPSDDALRAFWGSRYAGPLTEAVVEAMLTAKKIADRTLAQGGDHDGE